MEKIIAAICEDNAQSLLYIKKQIESMFEQMGECIECSCFSCAKELLDSIRNKTDYDILFLDIDMPEMNGIELSKIIRKEDFNGIIVFISNKEALVFETFQVQPFRFIRKNHFSEELGQLTTDILHYFKEKKGTMIHVCEQHSDKVYSFNIAHIQYIEVIGKYWNVVTRHHETVIRYPLSEFGALLRQFGFLMPHRSYLVNYRYIYSIQKNEIELDTGIRLPISRNRRDIIKQEYLVLNSGGFLNDSFS